MTRTHIMRTEEKFHISKHAEAHHSDDASMSVDIHDCCLFCIVIYYIINIV